MASDTPSRFTPAPMDPDEFSSGRPDAFIGTILGTYAFPYKGKNSSDGKFYLNCGWLIQPDPDSGFDLFTESYNAGFLNQAVPSKDNASPAGASDDDYIALSNGKYGGGDPLEKPVMDEHYNVIPSSPYVGEYVLGKLSKGRSWEQAVLAMRDADTKGLADFSKPGFLGFGNGLRCRFDRVPQTSSGKAPAAPKEGQREFKVLVPTEVLGRVEAGAGANAGKGKSAGGAGTAASAPAGGAGGGGSDFDTAIKAAILTFLATQPEGKALVGTISTKVSSEMKKAGFDKVESMGWILETRTPTDTFKVHLADIDGTSYDPEAQTLELE